MTPFVVDNILPDDLYRGVQFVLSRVPMQYGSKSNVNTDPHGHWSWKPLHDERRNLADLRDGPGWVAIREIKQVYEKIVSELVLHSPTDYWCLIRAYANAHTYGIDGYFHRDSEADDQLTAILYVCDKWVPDWAGETVWYSNDLCDGGIKAVLPAPNRLLVIPSNIMHAARAVSRKCNELRTTLVFKLRPRLGIGFETLSEFLVGKGALNIKHGDGTLHDHLMRTYLLLHRPGRIEVNVTDAGGLHSIYGTNAFPHRLLEPNAANRAMVAGKFGSRAEALAYLFSVLDRPRTLDQPTNIVSPPDRVGKYLKLTYDQKMLVDDQMLHDLQLIECANLADQGALGKWPNLQKVWSTAS